MKPASVALILAFWTTHLMAQVPSPLRDLPKEGLRFEPAGSIQNACYKIDFFKASWEGGRAYIHDLYRKDGHDWVLLNSPAQRFDQQWIVFRGKLNRNNYYSAPDKHWVAFTNLEIVDG